MWQQFNQLGDINRDQSHSKTLFTKCLLPLYASKVGKSLSPNCACNSSSILTILSKIAKLSTD